MSTRTHTAKTNRRRKKPSRTGADVSSDDEAESKRGGIPAGNIVHLQEHEPIIPLAEISSATQLQQEFASYYMRKVTQEFADDLDNIRAAEDFNANALSILINALEAGSSIMTKEEQERVVTGNKKPEVVGTLAVSHKN